MNITANNEIEDKNKRNRINKAKSCLLKNPMKIDKTVKICSRQKRENTNNEKRDSQEKSET